MECLLIGGAPSVGKSECIYRATQYLINQGYHDTMNSVPGSFKDFRAVLEGVNKNGKNIRIIINTPTDTANIIKDFKKFYDENGYYDILISSIRDDNFWPRQEFFKIMNFNLPESSFLEIPLGKVTRRQDKFKDAIKWYKEKIDKLIVHTLKNRPFDI